jgi:hypothetical protein
MKFQLDEYAIEAEAIRSVARMLTELGQNVGIL